MCLYLNNITFSRKEIEIKYYSIRLNSSFKVFK